MERLTIEYGHKSKPEVISPDWNNRDPRQKRSKDGHSSSPVTAIVTAKGETPPPKSGLNGKCSDPNISEKISKLITRLPQLGKGIRLKKRGEYIPLALPETSEKANAGKNDTETRGKRNAEEIEGYDLDEINDNASYWTSGYEDDDLPDDGEKVVPKYAGDPPNEEELEMPELDEPYVPEEPGGESEPYDPNMPAITRASSVDSKEAPSLFERFAYLGGKSTRTVRSRPPILKSVNPVPDQRRSKSTDVENKYSKGPDSTHGRDLDGLRVDENRTERRGASESELCTEADLKSSRRVEETPAAVTWREEPDIGSRAIGGKTLKSNELSTKHDRETTDIPESCRSSTKTDRPDGGHISKVESPEKHRHRHKTKKHKEKHSKHERNDSEEKKKGVKERDIRKDRRSTSKVKDEKLKKHSHEESKEKHRKEKNKSEEKHKEHDSRPRKDSKHESCNSRKREERPQHDSEVRKSRSNRGKHEEKDRRRQNRENSKEAKDKRAESESDDKKNDSKNRSQSREKSTRGKFNKDPSQKLIVDTFDFFSLPVKKPRPEKKLAVDARRTVPLPSSIDGTMASKSKRCEEPKTDKESKERKKTEEVPENRHDTDRREPARESLVDAVNVDNGSVDLSRSVQNSTTSADHSSVKSQKESSGQAASSKNSADRHGTSLENVKTLSLQEPSSSTASDSIGTVSINSGVQKKKLNKKASIKQSTDTEYSDSSKREAKRPRKAVSLKRRAEDCNRSPAFLGHKRLNRGGGIRRNQMGRNTPMLAKRRRTDLTREDDEYSPPEDRNNLINAFSAQVKFESDGKVKDELREDDVVKDTASPLVNARPSRNRSTPVRYSPPRRVPRSAWRPAAPAPADSPVKEETHCPSPAAATPSLTPEPLPKAKRRRVKAANSKESKTLSDYALPTDSISEPYLSFLKQHNVAQVLLRFRTAPLVERILKVDPESEPMFRFPSTMFSVSRHGFALVNKKKLPAGMRGFKARAYNGSPNISGSRKYARKSIASPMKSPLKAVKSPLKSPAKVMKSTLKSPSKLLKSPLKEKRSPLKLKISFGKSTLTKTSKKAKIDVKCTKLAGSLDLEKNKISDQQPESPLKKVKNLSKLSPLAKSKKAFAKRKGESTSTSTSPTKITKEKAELQSPKTGPTVVETSPKKALKPSLHAKQAKLSPFLKAMKQWPTSPAAANSREENTRSPFLKSLEAKRLPLESSLKAINVKSKENDDQLAIASQAMDSQPLFVQFAIPEAPLVVGNVANAESNSLLVSSKNAEEVSASLEPSLAGVQTCPTPCSDSPSLDKNIPPLDESSMQEVIRTLQLDIDPLVLTGNSTTQTDKTTSEILDGKPKRRPKLPLKLQRDVIMPSLVKTPREKVKTTLTVTEAARDIPALDPELLRRTNTIVVKPSAIGEPGCGAMSYGSSISVIVSRPRPVEAMVARAPTRVVMATKTPVVSDKMPTPRVRILPPFQQQTIKDLFKLVQVPKKLASAATDAGQSPTPVKKRIGRPPGTPSHVSAPCASPKTPMSPKSPLISKPTFSPKTLKCPPVDQKKIRLQQKSKKLLRDSLRNARQKVVAKPSPKLAGAPLLLGDRKRLSRGAKERVITYNENSKTKTVDDVGNDDLSLSGSSSSSSSDTESDNESELASLRLEDDLSSTNKLYRILDTLDEHICLVDGLVSLDFDIASRKFLSNPVALLYNAEIRLAASNCNCLCFYEQANDWNDCRSEVPQRCGVELTEKLQLQDFDEAPDLTFNFSPDRLISKRDRNIFDLIASPENDQGVPSSSSSLSLSSLGVIDDSSLTATSRTLFGETEDFDVDAFSKSISSAKSETKQHAAKRTSLKSILNCDLTRSRMPQRQWQALSATTKQENNNLHHSEAQQKRACPLSVQAAKRLKLDIDSSLTDRSCESPLFERIDVAGSDGTSVSSVDTNLDEFGRTSHYRRQSSRLNITAIKNNPGRIVVQDIDLLMNVCEALEVFLTSDEHLLLDVGGYMSNDQALMLGYLCDYEINTQEKALKLKRTSTSRVPSASDLDAVINNGVYHYGAEATCAENTPTDPADTSSNTTTTTATATAATPHEDQLLESEPSIIISSYPRSIGKP